MSADRARREDDEATFADVRVSDRVVDLLAARAVTDTEDPLVRALAGWAAVVDAETEAATRPSRRRSADHADLTAALVGGVRPVPRARVGRDSGRGRGRRGTPWWALSAGAAAVIAAMAVGLGAQEPPPAGPSTVAESVQSVEATLVAARIAAERGDVVGARALLERARELVADLPVEERARLDEALGATEQGVDAVEGAILRGEPLPAWPDVPGLPDVPALPDAPGPDGPDGPDGPGVPTPGDDPAGTASPTDRPGATPPTAGQGGRPTAAPTTATAPTSAPTSAPTPVATPTSPPRPTTAPPAPAPTTTPAPTTAPTRTSGPTRTPPPQVPTAPGGGRPTEPGGGRPTDAGGGRPTDAGGGRPQDAGGGRPTTSGQEAAPQAEQPAEDVTAVRGGSGAGAARGGGAEQGGQPDGTLDGASTAAGDVVGS